MVYQDSWERSTGFDDETSLDGVPSYLFGLLPQTNQILTTGLGFTYTQAKKAGLWHTTPTGGNMFLDSVKTNFIPVNGIMFWHMYGKATHTVANQTQTITSMTTTEGRKTTIKAFQQWDGDTKVDLYGLMSTGLSLQFNDSGLVAQQSYMGCKPEKSTATPTAPILPDDASDDEITGEFNVFDSWEWNSTPMERPQSFSMDVKQAISGHIKGGDGHYSELSEHAQIYTSFTVGVMGNTNYSNLWTDHWNKTTRTLTWKMLKGSDVSKYYEVTASDCLCYMLSPIRKQGEVLAYTANFLSGNVSVVVVDFVDDDFYTIKT